MSQVPFTIPIESIDFKELRKRAEDRRRAALRIQGFTPPIPGPVPTPPAPPIPSPTPAFGPAPIAVPTPTPVVAPARNEVSAFERRIPPPGASPEVQQALEAAGILESSGEVGASLRLQGDLRKFQEQVNRLGTLKVEDTQRNAQLFSTLIAPLDVFSETVGELLAQIPKIFTGNIGDAEAPTLFTEGFMASLSKFRDRPVAQQIVLGFLDPAILFGVFKIPISATRAVTRNLVRAQISQAAPDLGRGAVERLSESIVQRLQGTGPFEIPPQGVVRSSDNPGLLVPKQFDPAARLSQEPGPLGEFFRARPERIANKNEFEDFVQNNIQPAFFEKFGDSPFYNIVRRGDEFLIDITTAGWEQRAVELGLERVRAQGNLYRIPPLQPPIEPPTTLAALSGPTPSQPIRVARALKQAESFRTIDAPGFVGGAIDKVPGISNLQRYLRPANKLPPRIQNAWVASGGERAAFLTDQFPSRSRIFQQIDDLFGARAVDESGRRVRGASPVEGGQTNVRFIGPESERVGIEGTILDIAQRPQFYDLTDEMRAFLAEWQTRQSGFQQELIQGYGARVKEFTVPEGSVFLSNVDRGTEMLAIMRQTEEQAIRQGRGGTRVFETAADRMKANPDFNPVTDIRKLQSGMDEYRSTVAGNEVFKQGIGGKTLVEVVAEKHPDLLKLKTNLTRKINNLKSRLTTAESQVTTVGGEVNRVSQSLDRATRRAEPLLNRVEELGQEWGPELSFLSGQVRELLQRAANLERRGRVLTERGVGALERRSTILTDISELSPQLDQVRRRYAAADLRPFQFVQEGVFRYLPADEAQSVRELSVFNTSHWVSFLDNMRGTAFSADLSPIAGVQLPLHMLFQPHRAVPRLVGAGKSSVQSRDLLKVFRESTMAKVVEADPQLARDFAFFTGLPVQTGTITEFAGGFLRMINPTILGKRVAFGEKFQIFTERMFTLAMRQSLDTFDDVTQRLARSGVVGDDAKVVAADMATKVIPVWNPARLGLSQSRAAAIRALPTSVSFILRPAALIAEATTGFAKIGLKQTLTAQEKMAVQLMTTAAGSVMALTTSSAAIDALIRGNDPIAAIKNALDPNKSKFMHMFIPGTGRSVPLGGPFRGILKVIWPREVDWAPVPIPFARIVNFAFARVNPFISTQIRQLTNKDFFGGKIRKGEFPEQVLRGLAFEIEGSLPLTGGAVISGARRGLDPGDIAEEAGGQFLGINLGQETPFQQQDLAVQRWAKEQGIEGEVFQLNINGETIEVGKSGRIESFYDLVPSDRQRFEAENPGIVAAKKDETKRRAGQGIEFAVRRQRAEDLKDASQTDQLADDDLLANNDISPTEWREKRRKRRDSLNDKRGEVYADLDTREPKTVLDYYFAEFDRIKTKFNNVMTDDAWQELEFWIESQPSEAQQFIDANTGLAPMTPKEQEYKVDLATLHPYFDIRDFVVRGLLEDSLAEQYQEWLDAGPSDRAAIQRRNPAIGRIESRLVSGLQDLMRIKNPEIDRLVRKWEYSTSLPKNPANLRELIGAR